MLTSVQRVAHLSGLDPAKYSTAEAARVKTVIELVGDEVRGRLVALYGIPEYERDSSGNVIAPLYNGEPVRDPARTILGAITQRLAAAAVLNPARGFQPQEETSASDTNITKAHKMLDQLVSGQAFIAPLDELIEYGMTYTEMLAAMWSDKAHATSAKVSRPKTSIMGGYYNPDGRLLTEVDSDV